MDHNSDKKSNLDSADYDRVLLRLTKDLENTDAGSWDLLQEKIHDAVELELAAAEMTRDELDLLKAYLTRDLKKLGFYAHETGAGLAAWLSFDLNALEHTLAEQLKLIADQTRVGQEELRERLGHDDDQYLAGEIATVGTLECLNCGATLSLHKTETLSPCDKCDQTLFKRVSNPWP
ncbi:MULTISPECIES: zinc ribbon-containing protein [unclassified Neptuniibacter]|uniref:zinc ribbon-containing protein n=1 Tax=unclassified Neptuniibacter TaxID=2630693 RepID=UPI000C4D90CC|nr:MULTISPECIES: zinc ribbon-containing protein [unclassified Neptuniibacter]MAY41811.1 metalloendopeptidase [Oceanospirillaceae bacterium]|tara:strand:- start:3385 stop:3915 length:531 start_codon:yes stop_codon:yes gene_type:complete